jgi:hypothetical protein
MLYREIIAVCSQIHTKHINTLCGQNVELLNVKLMVHIVTLGFRGLILATRRLHKSAFQQLVCLTSVPVILRCTSSPVRRMSPVCLSAVWLTEPKHLAL